MKLLLDQNLSHGLVQSLGGIFAGSMHVRDVGLASATDEQVWQFAKSGGFVIASKDEDFHQLSIVRGHPPKVIWVRTGNASTKSISSLLLVNSERILEFERDTESSLLVVS